MSSLPKPARCPNPECPSPTDVQKVVGVIDGGTFVGEYGSVSTLALRLSEGRPKSPIDPDTVDKESGDSWVDEMLPLLSPILAVNLVLILIACIGTQNMVEFIESFRESRNYIVDGAIIILLLEFLGIAVFVVSAIRKYIAAKRPGPPPDPTRIAAREVYNSQLVSYKHALNNWQNRLYYCHRCGSQFLAGRSEYAPEKPLEQILDLSV